MIEILDENINFLDKEIGKKIQKLVELSNVIGTLSPPEVDVAHIEIKAREISDMFHEYYCLLEVKRKICGVEQRSAR